VAEFQSTPTEGAFPEAAENLVARVVEGYLNNLLEEQMVQHLGAGRHERTDAREGYRRRVPEWNARATTVYARWSGYATRPAGP
jgi:transposase-like protein